MTIAEQVVITTPTPQEDPAHIAAMVAKVDGTPAPVVVPEVPAGERPSWLPAEYDTPEAMAQAFADLKAQQAPAEVAPVSTEVATPDAAAEALQSKGLSMDEFSQEFSTNGSLSPESFAKLEAAGIPKAMVDSYIAGQTAIAAQYEADIKGVAGGKFDDVTAWAATSLTEAEKVAYNAAIDSGNIEQAKLAVAGITAKFHQANPSEGNLVMGRGGAPSAGDAYQSRQQMSEDMRDPRYAKDPAFRVHVMAKLGRSNIL